MSCSAPISRPSSIRRVLLTSVALLGTAAALSAAPASAKAEAEGRAALVADMVGISGAVDGLTLSAAVSSEGQETSVARSALAAPFSQSPSAVTTQTMQAAAAHDLDEVANYALVLETQYYDGTATETQAAVLGVSRQRKGELSWVGLDMGSGVTVLETDQVNFSRYNPDAQRLDSSMTYDYSEQRMIGSGAVGALFNEVVRPLLNQGPERGQSGKWTVNLSASSLGLTGVEGGVIPVTLTREFFTHNGTPMALVSYELPAFSWRDGGASTSQWGRGAALTDPGFTVVYWTGSDQQAMRHDAENGMRPYRFSRSAYGVDPNGKPLLETGDITPLVPWLAMSKDAFADTPQLDRADVGAANDVPLGVAQQLDAAAFALAENSANSLYELAGGSIESAGGPKGAKDWGQEVDKQSGNINKAGAAHAAIKTIAGASAQATKYQNQIDALKGTISPLVAQRDLLLTQQSLASKNAQKYRTALREASASGDKAAVNFAKNQLNSWMGTVDKLRAETKAVTSQLKAEQGLLKQVTAQASDFLDTMNSLGLADKAKGLVRGLEGVTQFTGAIDNIASVANTAQNINASLNWDPTTGAPPPISGGTTLEERLMNTGWDTLGMAGAAASGDKLGALVSIATMGLNNGLDIGNSYIAADYAEQQAQILEANADAAEQRLKRKKEQALQALIDRAKQELNEEYPGYYAPDYVPDPEDSSPASPPRPKIYVDKDGNPLEYVIGPDGNPIFTINTYPGLSREEWDKRAQGYYDDRVRNNKVRDLDNFTKDLENDLAVGETPVRPQLQIFDTSRKPRRRHYNDPWSSVPNFAFPELVPDPTTNDLNYGNSLGALQSGGNPGAGAHSVAGHLNPFVQSGKVPTSLDPWEGWLAHQNRRELERLAQQSGYPNLASALSDAQTLINYTRDKGYINWATDRLAGVQGSNLDFFAKEQKTQALARLALGRILAMDRELFSTGGFSDIGISGNLLNFLLRDFGVEDGDVVNVEVTQFGRVIYSIDNHSLTNAGDSFNTSLGRGVVRLVVTAVNEGRLSPNTAQLTVDNVVSGDGDQDYSLNTGETAVLRIEVNASGGGSQANAGAVGTPASGNGGNANANNGTPANNLQGFADLVRQNPSILDDLRNFDGGRRPRALYRRHPR